ncbi:hypothetical protein [Brevundimonas diminuta]|jgi:hypothetical protein|uniref:hypothetical protein n=1 Tax=Brevundimonas diminuta TaxID=293 RepID=UPI0035DA6569
MLAVTLLLVNALAGALLLRFGTWSERFSVAVVAAYIVVNPLVYTWTIGGTFRLGTFLTELVLFCALWWCAEKVDRWWLILAAGTQLIVAFSHIVPLLVSGLYVWTDVSIRLAAWTVISAALLGGAWETWAIQKLASKGPMTCRKLGNLGPPLNS